MGNGIASGVSVSLNTVVESLVFDFFDVIICNGINDWFLVLCRDVRQECRACNVRQLLRTELQVEFEFLSTLEEM